MRRGDSSFFVRGRLGRLCPRKGGRADDETSEARLKGEAPVADAPGGGAEPH